MGVSLARFNAGLYAQTICFDAYSIFWIVACIHYFEKIYCVSCLFVRYNYICFTASNCWISGAWYFACLNCCILSCNYMCRAQLLVHSFASCFEFWHCMCNRNLALFFAMFLPLLVCFFNPNCSLLHFCFWEVCLSTTCAFCAFSPRRILLLFVLGSFCIVCLS